MKIVAGVVAGIAVLLAAIRLSAYRKRKKREARSKYRVYRPPSSRKSRRRPAGGIRRKRR